jgi:hypothetical protein
VPELTLVLFDRGNQYLGILRTFGEHFIVGDDGKLSVWFRV